MHGAEIATEENSKNAAKVAHRWQNFIGRLGAETSTDSDFLLEFAILKNESLKLLDIIQNEAMRERLDEIENYYYLFLLQQISKFNQYFNHVDIKVLSAKSNDDPIAQVFCKYQPPALTKNIEPIEHPLLPASGITMKIIVRRGASQIFRPAYEYNNEGDQKNRFYYNKKITEDDKEHQDRTHYRKANIHIGALTQYSNLNGLIKSKTLGQRRHKYFKRADYELHAKEQRDFKNATNKIRAGEALTNEELQVLKSGKYYRYNSPIKFMVKPHMSAFSDYTITHIGHAAEFRII